MQISRPEPYIEAELYYAEKERRFEKLPLCAACGDTITDDYAYKFKSLVGVPNIWICKDCMWKAEEVVEVDEP